MRVEMRVATHSSTPAATAKTTSVTSSSRSSARLRTARIRLVVSSTTTAPNTSSTFGRELIPTGKTNDYWQHDLIVRWNAPWDSLITVSVQNIFDKDPPYAASQYNYDYTNGNPLGRVFEVGFKKLF